MAVRIHLDNPHNFFTNLDVISGKIILSLSRDETISAIIVKLEGESNTTLARPPPARGEPPRGGTSDIINESHKVLYKLSQVFPPAGTSGNGQGGSLTSGAGTSGMTTLGAALAPLAGGSSYTLRAGQHEYPFNFKIPFNNMCLNQTPQMTIKLGSIMSRGLEHPIQLNHIKSTLPPSLSGLPGEAEIKYYIKATVQRPSLFKENRRSQVGFKFLPIEPPRAAATAAETFARRTHTFPASLPTGARRSTGFFGSKPKAQTTFSGTPPQILVDARLPNPAIITCNKELPLRIITTKQSMSPEHVFLTALQVELVGQTTVRAGEVSRVETSTWPLVSLTGLNREIGSVSDPVGKETPLDASLWQHIKLPGTVTPSFNTCNLTRTYELEVKTTIGFGFQADVQAVQTLPLRFPVQIFSGIAPPQALLNAMASRPQSQSQSQSAPPQPPRPTRTGNQNAPALPARPTAATAATTQAYVVPPASDPLYPPQLTADGLHDDDAPPPSYEDAIADEIAPVNGAREYSGITNENVGSEVGEKGQRPPNGYGGGGQHGGGGSSSGSHAVV